MSDKVLIGIIDDDPLVREEIVFLLHTHADEFELAFEAGSIGQFFEVLQMDEKPDVLLLDISLAAQNSLSQLGKLKQLLPQTKVVIITGHTEPEFLMDALQNGAHGYFLKSSRPERILEVIRETYRGGAFIEPRLASSLLGHFRQPKNVPPSALSVREGIEQLKLKFGLNPREIQVAQGLAGGMAYKEIAVEHNIGLNTVRHYVKSLYKKLGISGKQELVDLLNREP